jgi:hypothetical protein
MAPIDLILPKLSNVRKRQPYQWSACCPAHEDRNPSLSVRVADSGAVLLHCFANCSLTEILDSVGLNASDLFPCNEGQKVAPSRNPRLLTATQALELLSDEAELIAIAGANIAYGSPLTDTDRQRVLNAASRIVWLRRECMGVRSV